MGVDLIRPESLLLCDGASPPRSEKGTRGIRQGCGRRTLARPLGSGKLTIYLRAHERAAAVDLSHTLGGPETSCEG